MQPEVILGPGPDTFAERGVVFLPFVVNERPIAEQFFRLLWNDYRQLRPRLSLSSALSIAAGQRARGLANGEPWSHTDSNGITPNEYARAAGCNLPDHYPRKGNSIESLVAGSDNVQVLFDALAASPSHAAHLFGRLPHYQVQDKCGIGFAKEVPRFDKDGNRIPGHGWYMCILIGECVSG